MKSHTSSTAGSAKNKMRCPEFHTNTRRGRQGVLSERGRETESRSCDQFVMPSTHRLLSSDVPFTLTASPYVSQMPSVSLSMMLCCCCLHQCSRVNHAIHHCYFLLLLLPFSSVHIIHQQSSFAIFRRVALIKVVCVYMCVYATCLLCQASAVW